jgi:sulfatase modifying factor 1
MSTRRRRAIGTAVAMAVAGWAAATGMAAHALAADRDRVTLTTFAIDRTEVTIADFRAFLEATGRKTSAEKEGGGYEYAAGWTRRNGWTWAQPFGKRGDDREPAVHVTWEEASAFCAHHGGRLPTFAEWSKAAYEETRAEPADGFETGRTYPYPVGERPDGMNTSNERHVPVATTKRGVNGLYDMGANVWEWMADRRGEQAFTAGGSWWYGSDKTRREGAQWKPADFYAVYIGFRCAYDLTAKSD